MSLRNSFLMASLKKQAADKKIQLFFIGDSITAGEGTTGTGPSSTGIYNQGYGYPEVTTASLIASGLDVTSFYRGFPGINLQECSDYGEFDKVITNFNKDDYTDIYCVMFWGANDLVSYEEPQFETNMIMYCNYLRDAGAKVIVMPVLSRKDSYAAGVSYANIAKRNTFNAWALTHYTDFADALIDLSGHPEIFADDAPDNATYFCSIDLDGLGKVHPTDAGAAILANQAAETILTLSATISIPIVPIDEAAAFCTAAGISDSGILSALQTYVAVEKQNGIWWKLPAIYPFVGGNASAHKFNLRNPLDTDVAGRITFSGSPVHDANGCRFASSSFAETHKLLAKTILSQSNLSLHYYSKTEAAAGVDMGVSVGGTAWLGIKHSSGSSYTTICNNTAGGSAPPTSTKGLFVSSRANDQDHSTFYRNGILIETRNEPRNCDGGRYTVTIGSVKTEIATQSYPSDRICAYAAIGQGLTDAEMLLHYNAVQNLQIALLRQE